MSEDVRAIEQLTAECRQAAQSGATRGDIVVLLKQRGCTIIESMKIVSPVFGISLGEAKPLVAEHPAWAEVSEAGDRLHDSLVKGLSDTDGIEVTIRDTDIHETPSE